MTPPAKNWIDHYKHHPSSNALNQQMESTLALVKNGLPEEVCFKNLKDNPGLACLVINEYNDPNVTCFKLRKSSLFTDLEYDVPKWSELREATSKESVTDLFVPTRNPPKLRCKNILLIPPFVTAAILESETLDPSSLIPI
jgi:hypothetical protein